MSKSDLITRLASVPDGDPRLSQVDLVLRGETLAADQPLPKLLTQKQFGDLWGCSTRTIMRLCAAGDIKFVRLGKRMVRIPSTELLGKGGVQ